MTICFCRVILAALVIVFAWWNVAWAPIALTIIGALLVILGFTRACCCCTEKKQPQQQSQQQE